MRGNSSFTNSLKYPLYSLIPFTQMVSRKQSLIKTAVVGSFLKQFNELKVGMILPGFTRQLMPYGVFVEFSPNIYGLAPNSVSVINHGHEHNDPL